MKKNYKSLHLLNHVYSFMIRQLLIECNQLYEFML